MPTSIALLLLRDGENASYTRQHIKAYQDYPQARGILCAFHFVSTLFGRDLMLARSGLLALNTTQIITDQVSMLSNLVYTQYSPDLFHRLVTRAYNPCWQVWSVSVSFVFYSWSLTRYPSHRY